MDSGARKTRAYHEGHVPPCSYSTPSAAFASPDDNPTLVDDSVQLSPRQAAGPPTLTPEDIRTRIQAGSRARSISSVPAPIKGEHDNDVRCAIPVAQNTNSNHTVDTSAHVFLFADTSLALA